MDVVNCWEWTFLMDAADPFDILASLFPWNDDGTPCFLNVE